MVSCDRFSTAVLLRPAPPSQAGDHRRHRVVALDPVHRRRYVPAPRPLSPPPKQNHHQNPHSHLAQVFLCSALASSRQTCGPCTSASASLASWYTSRCTYCTRRAAGSRAGTCWVSTRSTWTGTTVSRSCCGWDTTLRRRCSLRSESVPAWGTTPVNPPPATWHN